jgi:hypothetical protein
MSKAEKPMPKEKSARCQKFTIISDFSTGKYKKNGAKPLLRFYSSGENDQLVV